MSLKHEFTKGLVSENPLFRVVLGICPALAVSTALKNGVGLGVATTFVLLGSNSFASLVGRVIPERAKMLFFMVVAAGLVTVVDRVMTARTPELRASLGIFVPLIVTNCIILARAESFASRHGFVTSLLDGLGMGIGFTLALCVVSAAREIIGSGRIWDRALVGPSWPVLAVALAPGAFITLGLSIGLFNLLFRKA